MLAITSRRRRTRGAAVRSIIVILAAVCPGAATPASSATAMTAARAGGPGPRHDHWSVIAEPPIVPPAPSTTFAFREADPNLLYADPLSRNDVWLLGDHFPSTPNLTFFGGQTLHWNGSTLTRVHTPAMSDFFDTTDAGLSFGAPGDGWFAGYSVMLDEENYVVAHQSGFVVEGARGEDYTEHWNGRRWAAQAIGSAAETVNGKESFVTDIAFPSHGGEPYFLLFSGALWRWNGQTWVPVAAPSGFTTGVGLGADTASDVWVGGAWPPGESAAFRPVAARWNGSSWTVTHTPWPLPAGAGGLVPQKAIITGISVLSPNNVWATVWAATQDDSYFTNYIEHWDGSAWHVVPSPDQGIGSTFATSIDAASPSDVWVTVSNYYAKSPSDAIVEHWNGTEFTVVGNPNPPATFGNQLFGGGGNQKSCFWAVGTHQTYDPYRALGGFYAEWLAERDCYTQ